MHSHDHHGHGHDHSHHHGHGGNGHHHGHSRNQGSEHGHHSHSHGHGGHHHHHGAARDGNKKGLAIALAITAGVMLLEFVGGLITNSLALLSDSGHMLSDAGALALSLVAIWFATRPATAHKTYGFHRFEILAALFNGITLFVVAGFIVWEAVRRFSHPPEVASIGMLTISTIGLLANLASAWALMRKGDVENNVNLRSAYLHVLGDALGSVGAIVAGILMAVFGWYLADPIVSVLVSVLILKSAWGIINHTVHILMEGAPSGVHRAEVTEALLAIEGVRDVHDLHIWTITSGFDSLSCHLRIDDHLDSQEVLRQAIRTVESQFRIEHVTIQVETAQIDHGETCQ